MEYHEYKITHRTKGSHVHYRIYVRCMDDQKRTWQQSGQGAFRIGSEWDQFIAAIKTLTMPIIIEELK